MPTVSFSSWRKTMQLVQMSRVSLSWRKTIKFVQMSRVSFSSWNKEKIVQMSTVSFSSSWKHNKISTNAYNLFQFWIQLTIFLIPPKLWHFRVQPTCFIPFPLPSTTWGFRFWRLLNPIWILLVLSRHREYDAIIAVLIPLYILQQDWSYIQETST